MALSFFPFAVEVRKACGIPLKQEVGPKPDHSLVIHPEEFRARVGAFGSLSPEASSPSAIEVDCLVVLIIETCLKVNPFLTRHRNLADGVNAPMVVLTLALTASGSRWLRENPVSSSASRLRQLWTRAFFRLMALSQRPMLQRISRTRILLSSSGLDPQAIRHRYRGPASSSAG